MAGKRPQLYRAGADGAMSDDEDGLRPLLFVRDTPVDLSRPPATAEEYLLHVRFDELV